MKLKFFLLAFLLIAFVACSDTKTDIETSDDHATEAIEHSSDENMHDDHSHHSHNEELTLNNGEKWQVDESTRHYAIVLNNIVDVYEKESDKSLNMQHQLADNMLEELNKLIKGCTMDGPDHDALHLWLEPVIDVTKELKQSTNEAEAKDVSIALFENVRKFNKFFE